MLEITEEIKKYLDSTAGRKYFREITPELSAQARHEFKKTLLNTTEAIRKRARALVLLDNKIKEVNIKKTLDNA
jgi:hypothetical protein